jgi:2-amino-4-hydroxy-6-hydroxymethyldihydropteridine diphosphokinase
MQEVIIGMGSNLGDRRKNLEEAVALIGDLIGKVTAVAEPVETEPWGFESANRFLNSACIVQAEDQGRTGEELAWEMISVLQGIEADFGRVRTGVYTDRALDLDILFLGDLVMNGPELTLPHPRLHERDFVLIPLLEICPDRKHPVLGLTIRELCREGSVVRTIEGFAAVGQVAGIAQAGNDIGL